MSGLIRAFAVMVVVCGMSLLGHAADLSGTWKGSFDFNGSPVPIAMNLKVSGSTVTGTVEGLPSSPADIHDGKVDGNAISFWVNSDYQGTTYKLVYSGKVKADAIDFSFGTEDGNWGTEVQVKRDGAGAEAVASSDVSGKWKGDWDFNGNPVPVVFDLKGSASTVNGTVDLGQGPVAIHDGKVEGDKVTFWIDSEYQGTTYTLQYKGKVANGKIDFEFGTSDGMWGSSVTVKKA